MKNRILRALKNRAVAIKQYLNAKDGNNIVNHIAPALISLGILAMIYILFQDAINNIVRSGFNDAITRMFSTFR